MALSNFAHLAVDVDKNEYVEGVMESKKGVVVRLYKNWLYIEDEKAWSKDSGFIWPTIMQVNSGEVNYKDVEINAVRGPRDSLFAIIISGEHNMIFIGTWAYTTYRIKKKDKYGSPISKSVWKNVSKKDVQNCKKWIKTISYIDEKFKNFDFKGAKSYNQGDAFFIGANKAMNKNDKESIMTKMIKSKI